MDKIENMWDIRYANENYAYGTIPNNFFKEILDREGLTGKILLPADGEGRNSVYAAKKGLIPYAFDTSIEGRKKALKLAGLNSEQIDYINAHGTATPNNDLSESIAIQRVFGKHVPDFSSTKAFTGHTLAAAGVVEAVFSILALQEQTIFPNLNFKTMIPETGLKPVTSVVKKEMDHVLSNSFGFGGNCSTLIFSKA